MMRCPIIMKCSTLALPVHGGNLNAQSKDQVGI